MLNHFSHVRLYNPMDYTLPGSSIHGILQARILEWVGVPSSQGSSQSRDQTCISYVYLHWHVGSLPLASTGKPSAIHMCVCVYVCMYTYMRNPGHREFKLVAKSHTPRNGRSRIQSQFFWLQNLCFWLHSCLSDKAQGDQGASDS